MSTRPDWAMDRAAQIVLITCCPALHASEQMRQIAALLELTRLEGAEQGVASGHAVIDDAFRQFIAGPDHAQAAG